MQTHAHTHPVAGLFIFWELQPTAQSAITQVFVGQYYFLGKWLHFSSQNFFLYRRYDFGHQGIKFIVFNDVS